MLNADLMFTTHRTVIVLAAILFLILFAHWVQGKK